MLVISKTSGFREEAAIQASDAALAAIAKERGWPYFVTENGAVMIRSNSLNSGRLWSDNNSGDILSEEQRTAFANWIENGGIVRRD